MIQVIVNDSLSTCRNIRITCLIFRFLWIQTYPLLLQSLNILYLLLLTLYHKRSHCEVEGPPRLYLEVFLSTLRRRVEQLKISLNEQKHVVNFLNRKVAQQKVVLKRIIDDSEWEADDEEEISKYASQTKKKKQTHIDKFMMHLFVSKLITTQRQVRRDIIVSIEEICMLHTTHSSN